MNNDEFAFLNRQLAAMVRDGIPLEAALRRLCADMKRGDLRMELEKLEADLAKGIPLRDAVRERKLPELYRQMLEISARSNDLPGILTLLADHYQRLHVTCARLKGLMVYPAIVLCGAFVLSCFVGYLVRELAYNAVLSNQFWFATPSQAHLIGIWLAPVILALAIAAVFLALAAPGVRRTLRWKLPAFKDAALAQIASAMAMMLKSGVPLENALGLAEQLERGTPAQAELARWRQRQADGKGRFSEMTADGRLFPPLFVWTVAQSHEDMATGFDRAAEIYRSRASYHTELLLYAAMPVSVMALALVIITQIQPVISFFTFMMNSLGNEY